MKTTTLPILLLACALTGCLKYDHATDPDPKSNANSIKFRVTRIEGCEYIVFLGDGSEYLTHKGNCTNRVHFPGLEAQ